MKAKNLASLTAAILAAGTLCAQEPAAPVVVPGEPVAAKDAAPQQDPRIATATAFITKFTSGDFEGATADFDATMKGGLPPDKLKALWESLPQQVGPFKSFTPPVAERDLMPTGPGLYAVQVPMVFEKMNLDARVVVDAGNKVTGLFFVPGRAPQQDVPPPAYLQAQVREIVVTVNEGTEWPLPGVLTLPGEGDGPFPAVVIVHGSGPGDRDGTMASVKPYRDLAKGLAAQGVASLRYDKRTMVHGAKMAATAAEVTPQIEVIDDAIAAIALARARKEIDPARVFVLGHSLGAMLAPRIARDGKANGAIMMAAPVGRLEDLLVPQHRHLAATDGAIDDAEKAQIDELAKVVDKIKHPPADEKPGELLFYVGRAYWNWLAAYDQAAEAKALDAPVFILGGGQDYQVPSSDTLRWLGLMRGKAGFHHKFYGDLNHAFVKGDATRGAQDYMRGGNVDERPIADIAQWIASNSLPK